MQTSSHDKRTDESLRAHTGRRLREARLRLNLSQEALAEKVGASARSISRWERGEVLPYPHMREQLCRLFGMTTAALFEPGEEQDADPAERLSVWHLPAPRNPFFTGRDPLLEQLHQQLMHEHRAALSQSTVLSGLGGIGKTQTALEYAYRHVHDYTALFWIAAETAERLVSSFLTLADTLQLPERLDSDKPRVVSAVLRWLATHQGWLLIFDNVEDLETLKPFVPTVPHGSIIFTTRLQAVGNLASLVTVETMGLAEGTLFLLRRAKLLPAEAFLNAVSEALLAEAEALVIELDFLPLALDQAGAYIEEIGCSPATYLELYRSRRKDLLQRRGHTPSEHPESVATTWSLSFQRIEQRNSAAADLLRMCAFLEPDAMPEELLQEGCLTLGSLMQAVATDLLAFHAACEELARFSLVQRDRETRLLRIHRLVQAVLKDAMEIKEQERWIEHMIRATERVFPATVDVSTWSVCQRLLPQAQMGSLWAERFAVAPAQAASLLLRTAHYLRDVALYEQAEQLSRQVLTIRERMLTQEHLDMAHSLHELAEVSRQRGSYTEAESLYQRALAIWEQHLGPEHPDVATSLNGQANVYVRQGRYAEAEPLFQRALAIWEQHLGPDHLEVTYPLQGLGTLYHVQGRYAEADLLLQRVLAVREQHLGPDHLLVASPLNNLAELYLEQSRYAEAEPLLQRALAIWEQHLGLEHPQVTHPLHGLAILYSMQSRYAEAEPFFRRVLAIREHYLGPDHLLVASPLNNLAELYLEQSRYAEAEPLLQRALAIWEQHLGLKHPQVTYPLHGLGTLYSTQGRHAEAEPLLQRALAVREQHLGPDHPQVARPLNGLGTLYSEQGRHAEAEPLFQRALSIQEQHLSPEHPDTAETLHNLATLRERQGNHQEARMLYQRALHIREQALGSAHPKTMQTRTCLMTLLHVMGWQEEAAT